MGFDTFHIFALDEVLMESRPFYIKNLQRVQVEGEDLGGWMEFMAEAILETLERLKKRIEALGSMSHQPISLTLTQEKLIHLLRESGPLPIGLMAQTLKLTVPGVHYALDLLLKQKIVKVLGSHKNTRYTIR